MAKKRSYSEEAIKKRVQGLGSARVGHIHRPKPKMLGGKQK